MQKNRLAYYISAHGYGHGVRSCDILNALLRAAPDCTLLLVSDLPEAFFRSRLPRHSFELHPRALDVGMVQLDSIRVDVPATWRKVECLLSHWDAKVRQETDFLRGCGAQLVAADIPALPLEAAARLGLPRLAVGNFSWDWIYAPFIQQADGWREAVQRFAAAYQQADLLLRLPFSPAMETFPRQQDIALLASPGTPRRQELARRVAADPAKTWVLLSFTTLDWDEPALREVEQLAAYEFFTVKPLEWRRKNIHAVDRDQIPFSDVLASVDGVVTKPGFGILSECIANAKPIIYAERTDFIEYPILVQAIERYCCQVHIPCTELYRGHLASALAAIRRAPPPREILARGGAEQAAKIILERCGVP